MTEHQDKVDRLEAEADQLEQRNEQLGEDIADVRENWEQMRQDESMPSAPAPESGLPPEANQTTSGDQPPEAPGDDG
ncbi:hypothetical protein DVA67_012990 [Solirubrobacter sp. CPCC 204708]|uniref:Uncharacterized protein n=1 Tax=Solirubrobacter deserti TaxID=2282478 RepID=A0ABT4RMC9_9ACTN|nr:hypothetical protein [Solirubrobacter deserti]MBE2316891.1 hypothetical protein [Solirubrobacter deserti]MDA0139722.1 hypothetical protein [Solirubrobacter deserti]